MARVRQGGSKRWKDRAGAAGEAYTEGVKNPRQDWATATKAAEANWKAGLQDAMQRGAFGKGVTRVGSDKQMQRAQTVGRDRFIEGVALSEENYRKGIEPYISTLENLTLPPRFPRGDARNIERVKAVAKALNDRKKSM